jgi:hypothetical protein
LPKTALALPPSVFFNIRTKNYTAYIYERKEYEIAQIAAIKFMKVEESKKMKCMKCSKMTK